MALKRTLFNCRLKTRVAICAFAVILICSLLMYRALTSHASKTKYIQNAMPTYEYKRPFKLQPKHFDHNIPSLNKMGDTFRNQNFNRELWDVNLIPKESETLKDRDLLSADSKEALSNFLLELYPKNWAEAPETDEVALELKHLLVDYGFESKLSCKDIDRLRLGTPISFSRTKFVEYAYESAEDPGSNHFYSDDNANNGGRGLQLKSEIAIKSPSNDMETKIACMKQVYDPDLCSTMGNYRMLREVLLLSTLRHPNILYLKGYCLRGNRVASKLQEKGLVIVTDVGTPLSQSIIHSSTWAQRVAMALQVGRLLLYLESSPFGSLRFEKLELKDFVIVKGQIVKLADLDDIRVGERACNAKEQCDVPGHDKLFPCPNGFCKGLNAVLNLQLAVKEILKPLLRNPPSSADEAFCAKMIKLEMSTSQLVAGLQTMFNKYPPEAPVRVVRPEPPKVIDNRAGGGRKGMRIEGQPERDENRIHALIKGDKSTSEAVSQFIRQDHKNFGGIYDYPCEGSRVNWGCVFTVSNLVEAANLCLHDERCRCFVAYTARPDEERLMTVVLKNATDSAPVDSSGTTLFILDKTSQKLDNGRGAVSKEQQDTHASKSSTEIQDCRDRALQFQESARYSREKRLMAHLGLKGIREQSWRRSALKQNLEGYSRLVRAEGGGGKFTASLTKLSLDDPDEKATKVVFISEDGPRAYHVAYALVYHLDRLLGLYHTPPCVGKQLNAETVNRYHNNANWEETFRPLIESDGTLQGVMVVPTPKVMKVSKLTLTPLQAMTNEITPFDRPDKLQLEYVLLWWLGDMNKKSTDHLGYKGHLIHFYADKAFTDTSLDLTGYLYHCQFPNIAYKTLNCYRCKKSSICSLGEEVIRRTQTMFSDDVEIDIHSMDEQQITTAINTAAASIFRTVDSCIKVFGRENVLY